MNHGIRIETEGETIALLKEIEALCPKIRWYAGDKPTGFLPYKYPNWLLYDTRRGLLQDSTSKTPEEGEFKLTTRARFLKKLQIQNAKLELKELPGIEK